MNTSEALAMVASNHYTRSIPSGKKWVFTYESAIVIFAIPPNKNISRFLIGDDNAVLELSRLWAPDGHDKNLLTRAISFAISQLRDCSPQTKALVSYADPNVGHHGGVYRAASWVWLGSSEESRYYRHNETGQVVSRRKFHSGSRSLKKSEILALGYTEMKMPGKIRFAKGLTRGARARINAISRANNNE